MDIQAIIDQVIAAVQKAPELLPELTKDPKGAIEGIIGGPLENIDPAEIVAGVQEQFGNIDLAGLASGAQEQLGNIDFAGLAGGAQEMLQGVMDSGIADQVGGLLSGLFKK